MYNPLPDSAAQAITTWITGNAAKSNKYEIEGYSVTFRAAASYGIFGILSTAVAIGTAFIPDLIPKLILSGIFGILGMLIILYGFVMRLTLDPERIAYRGPFGLKKQILWRDVKSVSVVSPEYGDILVNGRNTRIRIFAYLVGFPEIKKLLLCRFPSSFDAETTINAGSSSLLQNEFGSDVFKLKKLSVIVGLFCIIFALSGVLYSLLVNPQTDIVLFAGFPAVIIGGLLLMMYGFFTRLYVRKEKLIYKTLFLREKTIRWEDITSIALRGEPQHELLEVCSSNTRMKIRIDFKGYPVIKALILKHCPDSASVNVESLSPLKPL